MRATRLLGATGMATAACLLLAGTASAVAPADGNTDVLTAAGSDTIFNITGKIFENANGAAWNTDPDNFVNVPPGAASFDVPGDGNTPAFTLAPTPNGSSAGKTALKNSADAGDGKIDVARSSSPRATSDPSTFQYFAFARDGVAWASTSTGAGKNLSLTLTQLRDIYRGTITNWSQVGGSDAAIKLYLPQLGSGTLSFFTTTVLGFDPASIPGLTINRFQENDGSSIPAADRDAAIAPYSDAQWVAQGNAVETDKRAGFTVNVLTGAGSDGAQVSGTEGAYAPAFADTYLGSRLVFHVLDTRSVAYDQAKRAVGFDEGDDASTASPLCGGQLSALITQYGFKTIAGDGGLSCTLS